TLNTGGEDAQGNVSTHSRVSHLMVTTTLETLTGQPGAPAGEIDGRIPISTATVQRFACSANVSRVLLGPDSAVVDVGRERRLPSPPQRRALAVRDGGCVWPRCTSRPRFTEPHHVLHWTADGGSTDLANLVTFEAVARIGATEGGSAPGSVG
ncbi:MAG TPA: DUF222 domain-containing protein, partial [Gaiellaceae bacterium]|nr:DUF222 domain-containing protein [Gaiellaceae bacterium]